MDVHALVLGLTNTRTGILHESYSGLSYTGNLLGLPLGIKGTISPWFFCHG